MIDIHTLTPESFALLPLVVEGESKEIRDAGIDAAGQRLCVIKLKPTIYSFTSNRTGIVPGSGSLRLRATKVLAGVLKQAGIAHAYRDFSEHFILADLVAHPPNVEVIVKAFHGGTSKHRYYGMSGTAIRSGSNFAGVVIRDEDAYPHMVVRFDWRNPFQHPETNVKLADEILPEPVADWFISVEQARLTALRSFSVLSNFLSKRDIIINDLCLFITEDGEQVFGEISQDCGRFRHFDLGSLDKDVWRAGGSSQQVLEKWKIFAALVER